MKAKRLNQIFSCSLVFVHHQTLLAIGTYDSINDILSCQELLDCEYCPEVMELMIVRLITPVCSMPCLGSKGKRWSSSFHLAVPFEHMNYFLSHMQLHVR